MAMLRMAVDRYRGILAEACADMNEKIKELCKQYDAALLAKDFEAMERLTVEIMDAENAAFAIVEHMEVGSNLS